ncbi:hypothetical protein HGRIS_001403 [Hohenbuehelia grisea]|uniref:Uncharacterized protein n=1 Tax=Hohenbuehelia grisea TaxID=104357 RepID=A0ABR3JQ09_9AGAR
MFPCHCKYRKCNGKPLKRSTRNYHEQMDRKAAASNFNRLESTRSIIGSSSTTPLPSANDSGVSPDINSGAQSISSPAFGDNSRTAQILREIAEEQGRLYIETVLAAASQTDFIEDIGSLWDDFDYDDDVQTPAPGASALEEPISGSSGPTNHPTPRSPEPPGPAAAGEPFHHEHPQLVIQHSLTRTSPTHFISLRVLQMDY